MECVREAEILVEQQPPQEVLVCNHSGLVINKHSLAQERRIDLLAAMGRLRESALALCDLANNQLLIEDDREKAARFFKRASGIGAANGFTDVACR